MVAFDDHDPTASVDTFGRRIWGGAMRPPLTPLRFRFAGGRAGPRRGRTSSVGGRAGPFSSAAAEGSAGRGKACTCPRLSRKLGYVQFMPVSVEQ